MSRSKAMLTKAVEDMMANLLMKPRRKVAYSPINYYKEERKRVATQIETIEAARLKRLRKQALNLKHSTLQSI